MWSVQLTLWTTSALASTQRLERLQEASPGSRRESPFSKSTTAALCHLLRGWQETARVVSTNRKHLWCRFRCSACTAASCCASDASLECSGVAAQGMEEMRTTLGRLLAPCSQLCCPLLRLSPLCFCLSPLRSPDSLASRSSGNSAGGGCRSSRPAHRPDTALVIESR